VSDFQLPRDEDGRISPHDHPELAGAARIIRRIHVDYVVDDHEPGSQRLSTALFKHRSKTGHLSFDSENCILAKDREPADYVTDHKFFGAVIISVEDIRSVDSATAANDRWKIGMVPVDGNDCHAGLWGRITESQARAIQQLSDWLVPIPNVTKLELEA
jgi:hypothetical protein